MGFLRPENNKKTFTVDAITREINRFEAKIRPMIENCDKPCALLMVRSVYGTGSSYMTQPSALGTKGALTAAVTRILTEKTYRDIVANAKICARDIEVKSKFAARIGRKQYKAKPPRPDVPAAGNPETAKPETKTEE